MYFLEGVMRPVIGPLRHFRLCSVHFRRNGVRDATPHVFVVRTVRRKGSFLPVSLSLHLLGIPSSSDDW